MLQKCLASGEATRYSWKPACKQPSRLISVIFPLFCRDITYSISLEAVTTLIVFLSCQLFHKEILRESIIHRYLMHGRWYVLPWGLPEGKANTVSLVSLYLKTEGSQERGFDRKFVLLRRKEDRKANICKGSWRGLGGNLTAQTSVKLIWKWFLCFEGSFVDLKQHLVFGMVF